MLSEDRLDWESVIPQRALKPRCPITSKAEHCWRSSSKGSDGLFFKAFGVAGFACVAEQQYHQSELCAGTAVSIHRMIAVTAAILLVWPGSTTPAWGKRCPVMCSLSSA